MVGRCGEDFEGSEVDRGEIEGLEFEEMAGRDRLDCLVEYFVVIYLFYIFI